MAEQLRVDPVALSVGSDRMFDAVGQAAMAFVGHEDELVDVASGWIGSSQQALGELVARWESRHSHHKLRVAGLGSHVAEAMAAYVTTDDDSARTLKSVCE